MKNAIVLGATGGMGYALVRELVERGAHVKAFARNEAKLRKLFHHIEQVEIISGNAFSICDLNGAVKESELIFNAINLPYGDWSKKLKTLTENIIKVAKENAAKLAIVDNIYSYGRNPGSKILETMSKNPHTKKGKLRLEMEQLYKESGVPYAIVHFPDFYGPYVENSLLGFTLQRMIQGKKGQYVGDLTIPREHIYTPDGAKAMVTLAFHKDAYNQNWNIPAYDVITGNDIIKIMRALTNNKKKVNVISKNMLRFVGIFNKQMREFVEMQYLNEDPVVLDGTKYEKHIGLLPRTSYKEGIKRTIETMQHR